jgi:ABC-2 type transport system ATP-binding protein|tara:strand:- start:218 stop:1210 length:993 start_codon:yes stop_codon:yes gene_type:complete
MEKPVSISVNNLSRKFGTHLAVKNISFEIQAGEIVGFLGPNGAGKSTTMRILGGLLSAHTGSATVCGLSVAEDSLAVKRKIGFMQENNPLPDELRVNEYLRLRAELKEVPQEDISTEVRRVMDLCDLFRTARRKIIGTLSKGFKQRVGIADALIGAPEVIIFDEPTIGLDPHQIQGIRKLIDSLRGKHTVLISSHVLSEIEKICDRVIILNNGHLVAMGTKAELKEAFITEHKLSVDLTGEVNALLEHWRSLKLDFEVLEEQNKGNDSYELILKLPAETLDIEPFINTVNPLNRLENCRIQGIHIIEPDLEAIFLAATTRSWDEVRLKEV